MSRTLSLFAMVYCCQFTLTACAQDAVSKPAEFFEKHVRPVLVKRCYECHGGAKTKGGLSLDTRTGWQRGGDSGPAIVPGKPAESLLIEAINYRSLEMPPKDKGGKLGDAEIAVLTEWVAQGAFDPREEIVRVGGMRADEAKTWWAFQPLPVADKAPSPARIDAFIDARLTHQGLTSNPSADKRTLLRRATYDLIGLPPTMAAVEAFLADDSPDAFAKVVDRLLESPQYGVRWGRHWLDVVRYADTAGENTDRPLPHAWRYRNWVFDAFNRDLPYDEFIRLQLAGDILRTGGSREAQSEGIVATGYLAIARRFGHDIDKDIHLMHEDVIDNLGKSFLGLSIGCARCHDHKYDPITAQDYYALYGIFGSTRFAFPGCEPKGQPRDLVPLIPQFEVDALMKPWRERMAQREAEKKRRAETTTSSQRLKDLATGSTRLLAAANVGEGQSVTIADQTTGEPLVPITIRKGEVLQLSVSPNDNHGADSTLIEWTISEVGGAERKWGVADLVPSLTEGNPRGGAADGTWCFLEVTNGPVFLQEKREAISGNSALKSWSIGSEPSVFVNSADQQVMVWTTLPARSFFVHPGPKRPVAVAWVCPHDGEYRITGRVADAHPSGLDGVAYRLEQIASAEFGTALVESGRILSVPLPDPGPMPVIPFAYAVIEASPLNARLQLRGDPEIPGEEIPRRWLSIFGGEPVPTNAGSGRKQLGDWISRHPLAARVMVNRVWQGHFGQGIVCMPNDFGARGERPSHPELLDWLAAQFATSDYSLKQMHRLIMNTAAYQRNSARPESLSTNDPENRLLGRFNRRRLSAEEIRDSLLSVSGQLDLQPGGAHPFPPETSWNFTQHAPFNAVYETNKRSAYLMVQRQRRHPFLSLFDGADPNASTATRQTTTMPTQALYFLNDPFFHAQAGRFADSLPELRDDGARITDAYRKLFQREPTVAERTRAEQFLSGYSAPPGEKWAAFVRVLLAGNEFLHVD